MARLKGSRHPASVRAQLEAAEPGGVFWTEQEQKAVAGAAGRCVPPVQVSTSSWYAVHPETQRVVKLTRVEVK